MYKELADSYARHLTYDVTHVVIAQNLLPFLWKSGHLGGRTFVVLMSALPMNELQKRLDAANSLHPESGTLGDFRADPDLVFAEQEALRHAREVITSHTDIASLFPKRGKLLDWKAPNVAAHLTRSPNEKPVIVFPASTVARKGCYELRDAFRGLDVKLIILGGLIESPDFWVGFDVERGSDNCLEVADLVVLPAFVEHRPRRLLRAAASGVPVLATSACGVDGVENVTTVRAGESTELRRLIIEQIRRSRASI